MKCPFCGLIFEEKDAISGCAGCMAATTCGKIKCPRCNYEMCKEVEFELLKKLKKIWMGVKSLWKKLKI